MEILTFSTTKNTKILITNNINFEWFLCQKQKDVLPKLRTWKYFLRWTKIFIIELFWIVTSRIFSLRTWFDRSCRNRVQLKISFHVRNCYTMQQPIVQTLFITSSKSVFSINGNEHSLQLKNWTDSSHFENLEIDWIGKFLKLEAIGNLDSLIAARLILW